MIKNLLSASLLAVVAMNAYAYDVNDVVDTKTARFKVTGVNLLYNGSFASGTDGWSAIDDATPISEVFEVQEGLGPNGVNTVKVGEKNSLTAGMRQIIGVENAGTYVISFKISGGDNEGFTDLDLSQDGLNYINAYFNTDGTLATVGGTNNVDLSFGENGVNAGYQFSYPSNEFKTVVYSLEVPREGFIVIDLRGLTAGIELTDFEVHLAEQVNDSRAGERRIAYIKSILNSGVDYSQYEGYEDVMSAIADFEEAAQDPETDLTSYQENIDLMWEGFTEVAFSNVINLIPTTDGSANTGSSSANWMNWTTKFNKLNGTNYTGKAPWSFNTDRWCHKSDNNTTGPLSIQWMRNSNVAQNHIATLTATLDKGQYVWGLSGEGGMMTLNKNRWVRSWAKEAIAMQLFFNGDTTDVVNLDPAIRNDYAYSFTLDETKEVTLGIVLDAFLGVAQGADANLYNPVLYQLKVEGELTAEEKAFLETVDVQLNALKGRIEVAQNYLNDATRPWGKEALQEGITEAQARYDAWLALDQDTKVEMYADAIALNDTIMNNGVRFLNNNYINVFTALNQPFQNLSASIEAAEAARDERVYQSSTKMADLVAEIANAKSIYDAKIATTEFSQADSTILADEKVTLDALVESFKASIVKTNILDIDFGTQEAGAAIVTHEDPDGAVETYYTLAGNKGEFRWEGQSGFEMGYNETDSLGKLRVGNGTISAVVEGAPVKATDIVNIQFDYYFGNLITKSCGFLLQTEEGDTIAGLHFSKYSGTSIVNTFDVNFNSNITGVGSSSASNLAIAAQSNRTHFEVVLDYGASSMYCVYSGARGTFTTEKVYLDPSKKLGKFTIVSDYNNNDRRSWFDNLVIDNIAADQATAISEVNAAEVNAAAGKIYNVAGQQVKKAVAGQVYIQNGKKFTVK